VDGNRRLGWLATVVFAYIDGVVVEAPDDDAYELVIAIADGSMKDLDAIGERLKAWSSPLAIRFPVQSRTQPRARKHYVPSACALGSGRE
jgi:death-on-curing protein